MRLKSIPDQYFDFSENSTLKVVTEYREKYQALSGLLDDNPDLLTLAHRDWAKLLSSSREGRTGYTSEQLLRALLVMFICRHCPFVIHVQDSLASLCDAYQGRGAAVAGINSNDVDNYPQDSPDNMKQQKAEVGFTFPYLFDETQEVAKAYGALRTPHFYVFNKDRRLVYTGRGVDDPREASKATVNDLDRALEEHTSGRPVSVPLTNPIGCTVTWDGEDGHWMPPEACDLV